MQKSDSLPQFHSILSKKYWREAAKQLKSTQMLTIAALIVALRVAVKFINIKIAPGITITFDGYVNSLGSLIYGPVVGVIVGLISDTIGCIVAPKGPYFPPFALVEMTSSFLFGLFFWKRKIGISRALSAKLAVNIICNVILSSIFMKLSYLVFTPEAIDTYNIVNGVRIAKNLIMFPLEATIIVIVLSAAYPVLTRLKVIDTNYTTIKRPEKKILALEVLGFTLLSVALVLLYVYVLKDFVKGLNFNFW